MFIVVVTIKFFRFFDPVRFILRCSKLLRKYHFENIVKMFLHSKDHATCRQLFASMIPIASLVTSALYR
jgi:hypothetical protein